MLRLRFHILLSIVLLFALIPGRVLAQQGFTEADRRLLLEIKARTEANEKRIEDLRADMNERFRLLEKRFEDRFEQIDKRFEQIDKRFEQTDKRFEQIDKRFKQVNQRFNDMLVFMQILAGIFVALVVAVIGFAYWDRRTIIRKAQEQTIETLERTGRLVPSESKS